MLKTQKTTKNICKHKWAKLVGRVGRREFAFPLLKGCILCGELKVGRRTIKISRFRLDMGSLPITNLGQAVVVDSLSSDLTASGLTVSMTAGEDLVFGDVVYFKSDGKVWKADANGTSTYPAMGLAIATISADAAGKILLNGIARNDAWAWTVGGVIYLSTSAGALTQTQPTATDEVIQVLGVSTHADRMYFAPSFDYITHT